MVTVDRRGRAEYAGTLLVLLIGAGAVLLLATRDWQTVRTPRPRPFPDDVLGLSGRTLDAAPTALALVALAGVVAVIATRGLARQIVGVLVTLSGLLLVWRCIDAIPAVSESRARALVHDKHPRLVSAGAAAPQVTTHPVWAVLSVIAAVLVLLAGAAIAWRGSRWGAMSGRYEAPTRAVDDDPEAARMRADASLWSALERGEDPTDHDPRQEP